MASHRCIVEWQHAGDSHWYASGPIIVPFTPETLAAIREIVPAQGFPFPGLSAAALQEVDTAIHSTATLMTHQQVKDAQAAHERQVGANSNELRQILRIVEAYAAKGLAVRLVFWESLAAVP
jgi:hypothetical protein